MSEFNAGMSKIRKFVHTLEIIEDAVKNLVQEHKDTEHYKAFIDKLEQANPKKPVMNETNAVFYDVTGVGPQKMQQLLDELKIPNAAFIDPNTSTTVMAVPKQYERQANLMLSHHQTLTVAVGKRAPVNDAAMHKMTVNMMQDPSPSVIASMKGGTAVTKTFDSGRWMPLAQKMEDAGIPFAVVKNSQDKTTTIVFDQQFALPVHNLDCAIEKEKAPAELTYADFMKHNLGKSIVERSGLTEGQMREVREELRGSGAGYNVHKQQDGTYTVRYNAEQAKYIEPTMVSTLVRSNGINSKGQPVLPAMDAHAHYVSAQAEQAHSLASQQKSMMVMDASNPMNRYFINDRGLVGPDGKNIMRKDDPNLPATLHSITTQMSAPVVKAANEKGEINENMFTKSEIQAAKASHALAVPSDASLMAAQIATLKISVPLTQPGANLANALNDVANFCRTTADGIEEENFRLDPEELKDEPSLHASEKPEKVIEFEDTVHKLSNEEKATLSDGLRKTSNELSAPMRVRLVEKQDLALEELGRQMDEREEQEEEQEYGRSSRSGETQEISDNEIQFPGEGAV